MKAHFTIYMKIGEEEVNLSPFISKNSVSFNSNLCSTGWKSVTDTASMTLTFNDRNVARLQEILAYLVSAQQAFPPVAVNVRIAQGDTTVFRGKLDLGKLSVSSSKLPGTISLSAKSKMEELDVKPQNNFALWPGTVGDAVNRCLKELSLPSVSSWAPGIEKRGLEVPFVVTEDDSDTWRNKIDTLLCEMGGYVLTYDHATDTFAVSKINDPDKEVPETFVKYLVSSQLKSGSTRFSKDGVVVIYRNVKSEPDQIMYMKDISLSKDEATGDTVGEWVEPGAFFPEDADITKTFEEYDSGILDRGNLLETSRKQNNHMGLYFLDPDTTKIEITASDENYKGVSDWYSNDSFYSPEGGFTYPKGGEFYPTKAWIALKNKTEGKINVTDFRISGKVWYSDAEYRMVMPLACKDPEEYSSSYISKQETAKEYANFLMNIKRFGGDTSTWTERWEEHSIGDKVLIRHKSGSTITAVVVRKQTRIMGDELWADMTAVSLDGWRLTEDSGVETSTKGVSVFDEYGQAKLNGYTGTKEQWLARNDLYYIWSSSETELKPRSRGFWRLGGKWMLYGGRAVGDFLAQDWEKNWTEVMNERSETYRYLWAKVGENGEPFLFQGVSAADFSVIVSPSSYTINPRSLTPYKVNLKISRLNNLKGISDLILNNTYQGITLEKVAEDEWEVSIEQKMNTPLRFSFTASVNDASKGYTVTGSLIDYEEKYLGPVDTLPSDGEPYGRLLDGDWCVLNSENVLYVWTNGEWQPIENSGVSTMDRLDKMSLALSDMIKIGTTDKTTATVLGLFQLLCADNGFIKFLKTWALYCGAGDESSGFYCRIADHDPTTGAPLAKPLFIVKYNGNTVFQIDPASGNVFMGRPGEGLSTPETGFMYRASDGVLISKNGYVVIDDDGRLSAQNGIFKGKIETADGEFTGTFNTMALKSEPDTDTPKPNTYNSSGIADDDSSYNKADELYSWISGLGISGSFACTLSIDSSVTYGKISSKYTGDQSINLILLYTESGIEKYRVRYGTTYREFGGDYDFCSSNLTSAFTLTVGKFTGEKLYMNVPLTSAGITGQINRVYRDENGFLKVIT